MKKTCPKWVLTAVFVSTVFVLAGCQPAFRPGGDASISPALWRNEKADVFWGIRGLLLDKYGSVDDSALQQRLESVGKRLCAVAGEGLRFWRFEVLDTSDVLLVSLPGGYLGVSEGLMTKAANDAQLAGIVAHCLAHLKIEHGSERLGNARNFCRKQFSKDEIVSERRMREKIWLLAHTGFTLDRKVMAFSDMQESVADEMSLLYLARAGFDPKEAVRFWRRACEAQTDGEPAKSRSPFFAAHPLKKSRLRQLEQILPRAVREYKRVRR